MHPPLGGLQSFRGLLPPFWGMVQKEGKAGERTSIHYSGWGLGPPQQPDGGVERGWVPQPASAPQTYILPDLQPSQFLASFWKV